MLLSPEFWAGLPRPESRAEVRSWLTQALQAKEKNVFTDAQLFELWKGDNALPDEVRLTFLPAQINPRDKPELFEKIFAYNVVLWPDQASKRTRVELFLEAWCYRAIGDKRPWTRENSRKFVALYPEHARSLVARYKGKKATPSFVLMFWDDLLRVRRPGS